MIDINCYKRVIDNTECICCNESKMNWIEYYEPALRFVTEEIRVTQMGEKVFVYTGKRVVQVGNSSKTLTMQELFRIGKKITKELVESIYEPGQVVI